MIRAIILAVGATVLTVFAWRILTAARFAWAWYRFAPHTKFIIGQVMFCENCEHREVLMDPKLGELGSRMREFKRDHAGCKKKVQEGESDA